MKRASWIIWVVLVVLGFVSVINYVSSDYYKRWDLTAGSRFTLSKESGKVLGQVKQNLRVTAFFRAGTSASIRDLLAEYASLNKLVHYEVIDPDKMPTVAKHYDITADATVVLQYKGKTVKTEQADENGITNAIIKLLRNRTIDVCYLTGHGERDLSDTTGDYGYGSFKQALIDQDYNVTELLLPAAASIPASCTLVVDAGAIKRFLPEELTLLRDYLEGGGYLFVMIDPETKTGLSEFLSTYGINVGNNVVIDQVVRLFQGPGIGVEPVITRYSNESEITKDFKGTTIFPLVRTVDKEKTNSRKFNIVSLAQTSKTSWTDVDLKTLFSKGTAHVEKKDMKGPVSVAVAGTLKSGGKTARIAVFGTSRIAANKYITALFDKDFVMNTVSWLVKEENLITIRPKPDNGRQMLLTVMQERLLFYLTVVLIPVLLFLGSILAYRRMKRL